jgi:hypothetical protein
MKQELRNVVALRIPEGHDVPDSAVSLFPGLDVVVKTVEQAQLLGEVRPELREPFPRFDTCVQPWEVTAGHHEISKDPAVVSPMQRPDITVVITHEDDSNGSEHGADPPPVGTLGDPADLRSDACIWPPNVHAHRGPCYRCGRFPKMMVGLDDRPLLFLDVDGPLIPVCARPAARSP